MGTKTTKASEGFGLCSKPQKFGTTSLPEIQLSRIPFLQDLELVKSTQDRWTKLQEIFQHLSLKSVISARTLCPLWTHQYIEIGS